MTEEAMRLSHDCDLTSLFVGDALPKRLIYSQDSHAPMIVDILRGADQGETQAARLSQLMRACREREIALTIEIPFTTLSAPHLVEQIEFLHGLGLTTIQLRDCPDDPPYREEHQVRRHFSPDWVIWTLEQTVRRCRDLGIELHDQLAPWKP